MNSTFAKPSVLYHASECKTVDIFEPRKLTGRDPLEGPVVFATPDRAYASMFIVPSNDTWTRIGRYNEESGAGAWHIIINDCDRFTAADKGGSIYELPVELFNYYKNKNMGDIEWTSQIPVRPKSQTNYESGLEAMKELGINVYFVDDKTFSAIESASDYGRQIVSGLTPE